MLVKWAQDRRYHMLGMPRECWGQFLTSTSLVLSDGNMHCVAMPRQQSSWGQHGAHPGPGGPRWAPCWPHEFCYQGWLTMTEAALHWDTLDMHLSGWFVMMVADILATYMHQGISNHHTDSIVIIVSYKLYCTIRVMLQPLKNTFLAGWDVGNTLLCVIGCYFFL